MVNLGSLLFECRPCWHYLLCKSFGGALKGEMNEACLSITISRYAMIKILKGRNLMQNYIESTLKVISLQTRYGTWWEKMKMLTGKRNCSKASNIMGEQYKKKVICSVETSLVSPANNPGSLFLESRWACWPRNQVGNFHSSSNSDSLLLSPAW